MEPKIHRWNALNLGIGNGDELDIKSALAAYQRFVFSLLSRQIALQSRVCRREYFCVDIMVQSFMAICFSVSLENFLKLIVKNIERIELDSLSPISRVADAPRLSLPSNRSAPPNRGCRSWIDRIGFLKIAPRAEDTMMIIITVEEII